MSLSAADRALLREAVAALHVLMVGQTNIEKLLQAQPAPARPLMKHEVKALEANEPDQ